MDPLLAYQRFVPEQRAIVFATNVAHAQDLATRFNAAGVPAECVLGDTSRAVRSSVRERMTKGTLRALIGVGVFLEGFDLPAVEAVILARAMTFVSTYLQAIGRGLRTSPSTGKTRCTVLDLRGSAHLHGLPDEDRVWSLEGKACRRTEPLAALQRCAECLAIFRPASRCPRCGASSARAPELPRVLTRAEKMEKFSELPQEERDRRYLARLEAVARFRVRLSGEKARSWAVQKFVQRFGRMPTTQVA
jgi:superfamily II DNA or RNA helicase